MNKEGIRYTPEIVNDYHEGRVAEMVEHPQGDWISLDDYNKVLDELALLKQLSVH